MRTESKRTQRAGAGELSAGNGENKAVLTFLFKQETL